MNKYHTTSLLIPIIAICLFFSACNNDDDSASSNKTDIQLVTGINARENPNNQPLVLGNPNNFIDYGKVSVYPNPVTNKLIISTNFLNSNKIESVWLVKAKQDRIYQDEDFSLILNENTYSEEFIVNNAALSLENINDYDSYLNLEDKEAGYYKIFIKTDGKIYWDNIYKVGNNENGNDIFNYWK